MQETVRAIQELAGDYWFPEKGRLLVQADVIEHATGDKGSVVINRASLHQVLTSSK